MKVVEIFQTIQGEGLYAGAVTVFIRFAGCSLKCMWCDTQYAWEGKALPDVGVPFILDKVIDISARPRHICITGGEPLEQPKNELFNLLQALQSWCGSRGLESIVIETNGACDVAWLFDKPFRPVTSLSIDFKLPSSGREKSMLFNNFTALTSRDILKFVCANVDDVMFAGTVLQDLARHQETSPIVVFHAVGGQPVDWLPRKVMAWEGLLERFDIRVGVQLHKLFAVK